MLTYLGVYVFPPICVLGLLYAPLLGRRDLIKIVWLALMATLWTTPWDNYIISQSAWSYQPGRVWFTIGPYVPFEEHLFFILQPILIGLLHAICTLGRLIPFNVDNRMAGTGNAKNSRNTGQAGNVGFDLDLAERPIQTLPRRPIAAIPWFAGMAAGSALLVGRDPVTSSLIIESGPYFYLGCILAWICPVIGGLTWAGGRGFATRGDVVTWLIGTGWLWMVDTIAIRAEAWDISSDTSTGWNIWRGLPIEEALFFYLTNYLLVLSCSLISHLHVLLLLSPASSTPSPCPPRSFFGHIALLCRLVLNPPRVPHGVLAALEEGEGTLRRGSKSFSWAKLGWTREMRCALVATYGWCRITDDLIDDAATPDDAVESLRKMKSFLDLTYARGAQSEASEQKMSNFLRDLPDIAQASFFLFDKLLPRLVPRKAFDDLLKGYGMDLQFPPVVPPNSQAGQRVDDSYESPIKDQADLLLYADCVAGSVADMICHLAWAILEGDKEAQDTARRRKILERARQMGQALQLVNIARDVRTDAALYRVYIPTDAFGKRPEALRTLLRGSSDLSVKEWTIPLLVKAYALREGAAGDIERLPRAARAGTRAMVASYFEIGEEVRRRGGELGRTRLKVSKRRRLGAVLASWSIW